MKKSGEPLFQFYVPINSDFRDIPDTAQQVWPWICGHPATPSGRTIWTIYTCLVLKEKGLNCRIVREFPNEGTVIAHRDFLPATLLPRPKVFLVCLKPDRKRHSWAQVHIIQNPNDPIASVARWPTLHVPVRPQPSLIPRDPTRGSAVEHIAYLGRSLNLDPALRGVEWREALKDRGYGWLNVALRQWHDYSEIDLTVSVRRLGDSDADSRPTRSPESKPPSKLTNSWLAGVPAIVGDESSFRAIRKSELDFLVARSVPELLDAIDRLSRNPQLYLDMVANGRLRATEYSQDAIASTWKRHLTGTVTDHHASWISRPLLYRHMAVWRDFLRYWLSGENIISATRGIFDGNNFRVTRKR